MVTYCAFKHCGKQWKKNGGLKFFNFPNDLVRCRKWVEACGLLPLLEQAVACGKTTISNYYKICSLHFEDCMYEGPAKRRLHEDAIPTLFLKKESIEKLYILPDPVYEVLTTPSTSTVENININKRKRVEFTSRRKKMNQLNTDIKKTKSHIINCTVCNSTSTSLFRLPKEPERALEWILKMNCDKLTKTTTSPLDNNYRICGLHFEEKMFTNDLKNKLKPEAVPTIFPNRELLLSEEPMSVQSTAESTPALFILMHDEFD